MIIEKTREMYINGEISLREAAVRFHEAGMDNYIDLDTTMVRMGLEGDALARANEELARHELACNGFLPMRCVAKDGNTYYIVLDAATMAVKGHYKTCLEAHMELC